jgi:hypothetical protein
MTTLGTTTAQSIVAAALQMSDADVQSFLNNILASPASVAQANSTIAPLTRFLSPRQIVGAIKCQAASPSNTWSSNPAITDGAKLAAIASVVGLLMSNEAGATAAAGNSNSIGGNFVATLAGIT